MLTALLGPFFSLLFCSFVLYPRRLPDLFYNFFFCIFLLYSPISSIWEYYFILREVSRTSFEEFLLPCYTSITIIFHLSIIMYFKVQKSKFSTFILQFCIIILISFNSSLILFIFRKIGIHYFVHGGTFSTTRRSHQILFCCLFLLILSRNEGSFLAYDGLSITHMKYNGNLNRFNFTPEGPSVYCTSSLFVQ